MKKILITLILSVSLLLTFGCSRKSERSLMADEFEATGVPLYSEKSATTSIARQASADAGGSSYSDGTDSISANLTNAERKLVKRANISIRVENLETADASISGLLEKYDAYAASTDIEETARYYSLRVPAPVYDAFLSEMDGIGRLLRRSENTEDVTLRYYDLEGRLATKKQLLKTFQDYLGKAKTIEEILSVEARISELQYDIEGTGIQLRNLANRVDYATIDLNLLGPVNLKPYRSATLGERVKRLFGSFGGFLSTTMIVIIGIVVYGIPILLLVVFFVWLLFGRIGLVRKLWQVVKSKK